MLFDMDGRYKYLYLVSFMCLNYQLHGPVVSEVVTQVNVSHFGIYSKTCPSWCTVGR